VEGNVRDVNWIEVWKTVVEGFKKHDEILESMMEELNTLREQGYGNPLDGFVSSAIHAHRWDTGALLDSVEKRDADGLLHVLTSVLGGIARNYSEADFSWSAIWENYQTEYGSWLDAMRDYVVLGYQDKQAFIDYTARS
jgi:hypothetical protein